MKHPMSLLKKMRQQDQADTVDQEVQDDQEVGHFHQDDTQDHQDDLIPEVDLAPDRRCSTSYQQRSKDLLLIL